MQEKKYNFDLIDSFLDPWKILDSLDFCLWG